MSKQKFKYESFFIFQLLPYKRSLYCYFVLDAINESNPRIIDDSRARKLANDLKRCAYYETCATYGLNVERVFQDGKKALSSLASFIVARWRVVCHCPAMSANLITLMWHHLQPVRRYVRAEVDHLDQQLLSTISSPDPILDTCPAPPMGEYISTLWSGWIII